MSPLGTDDELSAAQAIMDISSAILTGAGRVLQMHGEDPSSRAILLAGFILAIQKINESIDPAFENMLSQHLSRK